MRCMDPKQMFLGGNAIKLGRKLQQHKDHFEVHHVGKYERQTMLQHYFRKFLDYHGCNLNEPRYEDNEAHTIYVHDAWP